MITNRLNSNTALYWKDLVQRFQTLPVKMEEHPLILTLSLNKEAFDYFTQLRDRHFPPHRNFLKAHLTLFHQLPEEAIVFEFLSQLSGTQKPFSLEVIEPMSLGRGVAFKIASDELQHLHKLMQQQWQSFLTPQDKQKLRPHITIQNKVDPEVAKDLEKNLRESFIPFSITGNGFTLWRYLGGPWELYKEYKFQYTT